VQPKSLTGQPAIGFPLIRLQVKSTLPVTIQIEIRATMQLPNQQAYSDTLSILAGALQTQAAELIKGIAPAGDIITIGGTDDFLANQPEGQVFFIKSGQLQCTQHDKLVYIAEAGDMVGLFRVQNLPDGQFSCEDMVELVPYRFADIQTFCQQNTGAQQTLIQYLFGYSCFFNQALAYEMPKQFKPATGFLQFDEGDVIINQGEQAECVYTLLEGSAIVTHDGYKVGEINAEEIFGAMALFTGQPRNATVTATSSCCVLAVRKDEFLDLVSHQPQVCMGLIEEMADKINQLNRQVFTLQQ